MKNWKRMLGIVALAALGLVTAACGGTGSTASSSSNAAVKTQPAASAPKPATASKKKILVAYFSATGSTKAVAETAAQTLHADLFEITPAQPYTDADLDYRDDASRVSKEHNDPNRHTELQNPTPPNFSSYDVVLVGAPIWWHEAAWPINDFLTKNDFTGKTVVPFVTSYSDPLGDSGKKMEALAGTGNWQEGMRFKGRGSQDEIEAWAKGLKF